MKKRAYSLTQKERKALRNQQNKKNEKGGKYVDKQAGKIAVASQPVADKQVVKGAETDKVTAEPIQPLAENGQAVEVVSEKPNNIKPIMVSTAVILAAVLLITAAILIPVLLNTVYRYRGINNPVARIELSTGQVIECEIFEDTCPIAATNFIFLAQIGYFDNTIIFDNQNNWVRFGGFEDENKYRPKNKTFTDTVTTNPNYPDSKFGYRLNADSSQESKMYTQKGILAFLYSDTATEFQIAATDGARLDIQSSSYNKEYKVSACGRIFDESMEIIENIAKMERNESSPHTVWKAPLPKITIKKVKMYNLDKKKWKDFDFYHYYYVENKYVSYWSNS